MKRFLKFLINFIFLVAVISTFFTLYTTFLHAYNNEDKQTLVSIDKYGEANFELVILTLFVPFIIVGAILYFKYMVDELA